jgi:hypothetical protein
MNPPALLEGPNSTVPVTDILLSKTLPHLDALNRGKFGHSLCHLHGMDSSMGNN